MKHYRLLLLFLLIILSAGCVSTGDERNPQPSFIDGRYLEYDHDDEFVVTGPLYYSATATQMARFEDVTVCMYDARGNVIASDTIDVMGPNESRYNVSLSTRGPPRYIIADHPRFGEYDFDIMVVALNGTKRWDSDPRRIDEFTYRSPDEPGQCGTAG